MPIENLDKLAIKYQKTKDPRVRKNVMSRMYHVMGANAKVKANGGYEDYIGSGAIGVAQALEVWDKNKRVSFSIYASRRIKSAIIDEIRNDKTIPVHGYRNGIRAFDESHFEYQHWEDPRRANYGIHSAPDKREVSDCVEARDFCEWAFSRLCERDAAILRLRFFENMSLEKIGKRLGVCEGYICQLLGRIIEKLKRDCGNK